MIKCYSCQTIKPVTDFFRDRSSSRGYNAYCKECVKVKRNNPKDNDICGICKKHVTHFHEKSIDHILAVARGGTHTWDNVQLAHRSCNSVKNTKTMEELGVSSN